MRHLIPSDRIAGLLNADRGLTAQEVEQRRRLHGSNDILKDQSSGWGGIARDTARDPMVWFLVATALLFTWLGDYVEASVLALALVPIAGMDAYLHRRTQATTEGLAGRLATQARVLRDGVGRDIPSAELVPGDLVIVNESESFPADGVLVAGVNLQADESALTGEAMPVRKRPVRTLQKFAAAHASIHNHFNHDRHLNRRDIFKQNRSAALAEWRQLAA